MILVLLIALKPRFHGADRVYAYAIAWLAATVVQLLMVAWAMRRVEFRIAWHVDWRDPRVKQVLTLARAHASPAAIGRLPPTPPVAPISPCRVSTRCIEPPRPWHRPAERPISSGISLAS